MITTTRLHHLLFGIALLLPLGARALPADEARHLLVRTGFHAPAQSIEALKTQSREQAVDALLASIRTQATLPPPAWVADKVEFQNQKQLSPEARKAYRQTLNQRGWELKSWWVRELHATDSPLTERMVLFWHNHFTSGLNKVQHPSLMAKQNELFRRHALGNFRVMTKAVARDPAMLIYLDGRSSTREKPNENFARELLELFTLGEGHYSEQDIKEAARAFTGWRLKRDDVAHPVFQPNAHDHRRKHFMGREGAFTGDDIIDIVLEQPRTAEFIVEKLWREFVSPEPDRAEVVRLAMVLRNANYELKPLLRALLLAPAFYAPENRGTLVKSPVDLLIGSARQFEIPVRDGRPVAEALRRLGQDLFNPPNVKGWPGGVAWISADTLVAREQVLGRLLQGIEMDSPKMTTMAEPNVDAKALTTLLLPLPPTQPVGMDTRGRDALLQLVHDPVYQLK